MVKFVVLAKPLAVELGRTPLIEEFISSKGARVTAKMSLVCDSSRIARHYRQFAGKGFFPALVKYYTGKSMVVYGCEATIETLMAIREAMGGAKVTPGSFRELLVGDAFAQRLRETGVVDNGIHCSDSPEEGEREWEVWFGVPPTSQRTQKVHQTIWGVLSRLSGVDSLQYAGGEHDGTAVEDSTIDLDYRILTNNVPDVVSQLEKFGLVIDKVAVDDESGATYVKFEYSFEGGKADIAVVPTESYRYQVSKSHLIYLVSDALKGECRTAKAAAKNSGDKQLYKDVKRQWRKRLLESINWVD